VGLSDYLGRPPWNLENHTTHNEGGCVFTLNSGRLGERDQRANVDPCEGGLKPWTQQLDLEPQRLSSIRGFVEGDHSFRQQQRRGLHG
jgi:hypothetical protein